jgi:membrane dipeptidase
MNDLPIGRRRLLGGAALGSAALALPAIAAPVRDDDMLIVNALGGFSDLNPPRTPLEQRKGGGPIGARLIADARRSGMDAVNVTLGYVAGPMEPFEYSVRDVASWNARLRAQADALMPVLTATDILRARKERRIGVMFGFQNSAMLGTDPTRAQLFADMGVRIIQLTYNPANKAGDGSMAPQNRGITPLGREIIAALNAAKVMVDLSHSGQQTCLDAIRASTVPISINHTGCRALTDLPRNKTDEELRMVAERGGFVGIYFMPFLSPTSVATPEDVVAHIDHAVKICGEDHVGIGTDGGTTGIDDWPKYRIAARAEIAERKAAGIGATGENPDTVPFVADLYGPTQFYKLIGLLRAKGYTQARIEKIMGRNFVSYARTVWGA